MDEAILHMANTLISVKEGLVKLKAISYFTDDEWIRLDAIIHKGRYVFTKGPAKNLLDSSPLLMYTQVDDNNDDIETIKQLDQETGADPSWRDQTSDETFELSKDMKADVVQTPPIPAIEVTKPLPPKVFVEEQSSPLQPKLSSLASSRWATASAANESRPSFVSPPASVSSHATTTPKKKDVGEKTNFDHSLNGVEFNAPYTLSHTQRIKLSVEAGDRIRILKPVSGVTYLALCIHSKVVGQVDKAFIDTGRALGLRHALQTEKTLDADRKHIFSSTSVEPDPVREPVVRTREDMADIDNIEETSAEEWQEMPKPQVPKSSIFNVSRATPSPSLESSSIAGRTSPDSATTVDSAPENRAADDSESVIVTKLQMERMVEAKFAELMSARSARPYVAPFRAAAIQQQHAEPTSAMGGREICGPWADPGRSCKYSDETCPNLHSWSIPGPGAPAPPRSPIITRSTSMSTAYPSQPREQCFWWATPGRECRYTAEECPNVHGEVIEPSIKYHMQTCYFWATPGLHCNLDADTCHFAHFQTGKIAAKPGWWKKKPTWGEQSPISSHTWGKDEQSPVASQTWGKPEQSPVVSQTWGKPEQSPVVSQTWGKPEQSPVVSHTWDDTRQSPMSPSQQADNEAQWW